jgi:hypothetical protein
VALLARARTARGVGPYDRRQFVDVRAVLEVLHQAAAGDRTGTVRRSMPQLVARLARVMGWARSDDRYADRDAHHASVRRWLRDLQTAGLLSWTIAVDDEGQEVALEFVLRPVPQDMREDARARSPGADLPAAPLRAQRQHRRRAFAARHRAARPPA